MKILAILPLIPWPLDRGDRMRAWEMLRELSLQGDLTIAIATRESLTLEARQAITGLCHALHVFSVGNVLWNVTVGVMHGMPPALSAYWNPQIVKSLRAMTSEGWDMVVAFQLRAAPYALRIDAAVRAIDFTDSLAMFRRRLPWIGRSGLQRLLLTGVDRIEARTASEFDVTWVCAIDDRQVIGQRSGRYPHLVPNGCIPVQRVAPYDSMGPLLFMGDMRYPANEDGILHFINTVWPAIHRGSEQWRLRITGRFTRRVTLAARRPGIDVLGPLQDVSVELDQTAAVINPVRYGSGSSRKIITGWAAGRPVISTRAGLRGLEYEDGHDVLAADTVDEWVRAVTWLRNNPASADDIGRAGWERARTSHDARHVWAMALVEGDLTKLGRASFGSVPGGQPYMAVGQVRAADRTSPVTLANTHGTGRNSIEGDTSK